MRSVFPGFFIAFIILILASCGEKDRKTPSADSNNGAKDTSQIEKNKKPLNEAIDSTLTTVKSFIEKELDNWTRSFRNFRTDSFRLTQLSSFTDGESEKMPDLSEFYGLYKPALSFSSDSNQFIDLYSSGLMLEKRAGKVIASADVDQAVVLCNLKTKEWKRIAFFGPSAGIEEAIWISSTTFILAGMLVNDNGETEPLIMIGDTDKKSFRWFEAKSVRPQSANYEASGIKKLKIDEWE
ncbi:MAG: hypothetical protein JNM88_04100 [Chitinophagaceae bacterium]|nr:hypothetical protein [Chitinophagaceae bacterium]